MSIDNQQKFQNYRTQMGRLNKALKSEFYLEAIFIEYAIMEDRLESILRHSGKWNPKEGQFVSLARKRTNVVKLINKKEGLAAKYFSIGLMDQLDEWRKKRNPLIHGLLNRQTSYEHLKEVALEGQQIVKTLNSKSTSYNRMMDKMNNQESET